MGERKKILFINNALSGGGSERVMCLLASKFAENKYDVSMIVLSKSENQYVFDSNIQLLYFYKNRIYKNYFIDLVRYIREIYKLYHYDIVISFMPGINAASIIALLGKKKTLVVSDRSNPSVSSDRADCFFKAINRFLYIFTSLVVFQTEDVKKYYPSFIRKKSIVIGNPVNPAISDRINRASTHITQSQKIVAVGRLIPVKNHELLVRAFDSFDRIIPGYKLVIYGEGPEKESLTSLINKLNLSEKVVLFGFTQDVYSEIADACMYVLTSNSEGMPNSLMEAMAMGLPVIGTDCPIGGVSALINDGESGILIKPNDKEALVSAMIKIVEDEEFKEKIASNARCINEKYSLESIYSLWEKQILKIC